MLGQRWAAAAEHFPGAVFFADADSVDRAREAALTCGGKLVERCINKLKNARRVATRYDKTAASYLGFIEINSARLWFRHLST
jgi:transposase